MNQQANEIIDLMVSMQNEEKRRVYLRFFKTGPGEYGYGDHFLGITNPEVRSIVKQANEMELTEIRKLLHSRWHEIRLCGLLILVKQFERLCKPRLHNDIEAIRERDKIVTFYLKNAECANNWDLVDLSVHKIIGNWLLLPTMLGGNETAMSLDYKVTTIDSLADSTNLWLQRMSVVCTWMTSRKGNPFWIQRYALRHLQHSHDLMHKAVGWMLREFGKNCSMDLLREFLKAHVNEMSRTTLRYAIERMAESERKHWMNK